jgi:phosphohistidine phosphatase SixA
MRTVALLLAVTAIAGTGAAAGAGAGCCPAARPVAPPSCTRGRAFVVVRHAEKESNDKDTPLSEAGRARAKVIASMLANANVTRLVASQYKRTRETLAPLAERTSLHVEVRPADKTNDLITELRAAPDGAVVVIATHSNVVPLIVRELGGGGAAQPKLRGVDGSDALPDDDFARVYVIAQPCGASSTYVMELSSTLPAPPAALTTPPALPTLPATESH